jgi:hypothetical protein
LDIQGAESLLDKVRRDLDTLLPKNTNNAVITVNAGGVGVWIATTACFVMLTALLVGAFWVSREFNRVDSRFNDQTDTDSVQDAYIQKLRAEQKRERK